MASIQKFIRNLSVRKPKKSSEKKNGNVSTGEGATATAPDNRPTAASFALEASKTSTMASSVHSTPTSRREPKPVVFDKCAPKTSGRGLGFNIAGGTDSASAEEGGDNDIFVTKIQEGGVAAADGRLQLNDIIVSVNGTSYSGLTHHEAVEVLRNSGATVHLAIKRLKKAGLDNNVVEIDLVKNKRGLGFNVAGGTDDQFIEGDDRVYITKISEGGAAFADKRLAVGDCIISVNDISLEKVRHDQAVSILKSTPEQVHLVIFKCSKNGVDQQTATSRRQSKQTEPNRTAAVLTGQGLSDSTMALGPRPSEPLQTAAAPAPAATSRSEPPSFVSDAVPAGTSGTSAAAGGQGTSKEWPKLVPQVMTVADTMPNFIQEPRQVVLKKKLSAGLGFNIVGGKDGAGIFVSSIVADSVADQDGKLRRGDQLLSVNGADLRNATHEEAAAALKAVGETAILTVQYRLEEFNHLEQEIREWHARIAAEKGAELRYLPVLQKTVFIRTLLDYDSAMDASVQRGKGLDFSFGDILHVAIPLDGSDWWQARRVLPQTNNPPSGLIPGKRIMEERERLKFKLPKSASISGGSKEALSRDKRRSFILSKKIPINVHMPSLKSKSTKSLDGAKSGMEEISPVLYQPVVQLQSKYTRPVMIFGPLKDRINNDLVVEFRNKYASCVPHTTRPMRRGETDGIDYHFVSSRTDMEHDIESNKFVEAGIYCDHLYGMSLQSIMNIVQQNKHCILEVSVNAIGRLISAELYPITILIKPPSVAAICCMCKPISEDEARKVFDATIKLFEESRHFFTAVVSGENVEEIYEKIKQVINNHSQPLIWVNSDEPLKLT